jgi:hypothetical protein
MHLLFSVTHEIECVINSDITIQRTCVEPTLQIYTGMNEIRGKE